MSITVRRSPAKVCWWVECNGQIIDTASTKKEAESKRDKLLPLIGE